MKDEDRGFATGFTDMSVTVCEMNKEMKKKRREKKKIEGKKKKKKGEREKKLGWCSNGVGKLIRKNMKINSKKSKYLNLWVK